MNIDLINQIIDEQGIKRTVLSKKMGIKYWTLIRILTKRAKTIDFKIVINFSKTLGIPLKEIIKD